MFQIFGHISGAHVNPVVTMAALILNEISIVQLPVYIISQLMGSLTGYGVIQVSRFCSKRIIFVYVNFRNF